MHRVASVVELCARKDYFLRRVAFVVELCARKDYFLHKDECSCAEKR